MVHRSVNCALWAFFYHNRIHGSNACFFFDFPTLYKMTRQQLLAVFNYGSLFLAYKGDRKNAAQLASSTAAQAEKAAMDTAAAARAALEAAAAAEASAKATAEAARATADAARGDIEIKQAAHEEATTGEAAAHQRYRDAERDARDRI